MLSSNVFNYCGGAVNKVWGVCLKLITLYTQCVRFLVIMWNSYSNTQPDRVVFRATVHMGFQSVLGAFYTVSTRPITSNY